MPTYELECGKCHEQFETKLSFIEFDSFKSDELFVICPKCGYRFCKTIQTTEFHSHVNHITETVGGLSEKNLKNLGRYGRDEQREEYNAIRKQKNNSINSNLANLSLEKMEKYINTGEK